MVNLAPFPPLCRRPWTTWPARIHHCLHLRPDLRESSLYLFNTYILNRRLHPIRLVDEPSPCPSLHSILRITCDEHLLICLDFDDRFHHTRIIRQHFVFLVDTLDAKHSGLVAELYQVEVLSKEERDAVNAEVTLLRQNEKLLSTLSRKTNDQFDKFLDALDNTGQQHVRNQITGRQRQ